MRRYVGMVLALLGVMLGMGLAVAWLARSVPPPVPRMAQASPQVLAQLAPFATPVVRYAPPDSALLRALERPDLRLSAPQLQVAQAQGFLPVGAYLPQSGINLLEVPVTPTSLPFPTSTPLPIPSPVPTRVRPTVPPSPVPVQASPLPPTASLPTALPVTPVSYFATALPPVPVQGVVTVTPLPTQVILIVVPTSAPPPLSNEPAQNNPPPMQVISVSDANGLYYPTTAPNWQVGGGNCAPAGLPVAGILTQRMHTAHPGIDLGVPNGTPVIATHSGTVIYAAWSDIGYGYLVVVQSGSFMTYYGHNTSFNVSAGMNIAKGTVIAFSGNTGNSTGPHVHYETRIQDVPVDPLSFESRGYGSC